MTNVSGTPEKNFIRSQLFQIAEEVLAKEGWKVERIAKSGKSSVRRITKGTVQKTVAIRTTQDQCIAFPRTPTDDAWATLKEVDYVIASSVDDRENPRFALVHMIDGDEMRKRFDRAYEARMAAGHTVPVGRGIWVALYEKEAKYPVSYVGAGVGEFYPAIAKVPLAGLQSAPLEEQAPPVERAASEAPLTIAEAKRRLALSLGVAEGDIKITISS